MNFNLVVDTSNFKPFTYLEKIAPLLLYKEAYDKQQEKMEKYSELLSDLSPRMFRDQENKDNILGFWNAFRDASDSFSMGMTLDNVAAINRLFTQGKADMKRYQNAISARNEAIKLRDQLGEDAIFNRDGFYADDFLDLESGNLHHISKKDTLLQGALIGAAVFGALTRPEDILIINDITSGYARYLDASHDVSDAVLAAIGDAKNRSDLSPEVLNALLYIESSINRVVEGTDVTNPAYGYSDAAKRLVRNIATMGVIAGFNNSTHVTGDNSMNQAILRDTYNHYYDNDGNLVVHGYNSTPGSLGSIEIDKVNHMLNGRGTRVTRAGVSNVSEGGDGDGESAVDAAAATVSTNPLEVPPSDPKKGKAKKNNAAAPKPAKKVPSRASNPRKK